MGRCELTGDENLYILETNDTCITVSVSTSMVDRKYGWTTEGLSSIFGYRQSLKFTQPFKWDWINISGGQVRFSLPINYDTVDSVKDWLKANTPIFYYELATPELIDISDILPADNLIEVEAGGTLTFKNQHGDDYCIPVPSEVEHMINVEEAL